MALVELRWQEDLGVGSFSVFICLTISIHQLKNPKKICWLDQKSGQMSQFSVPAGTEKYRSVLVGKNTLS